MGPTVRCVPIRVQFDVTFPAKCRGRLHDQLIYSDVVRMFNRFVHLRTTTDLI